MKKELNIPEELEEKVHQVGLAGYKAGRHLMNHFSEEKFDGFKYKVTHEGWFYLCPCYFTDAIEYGELEPIPKYNLGILLDLSLIIQAFMNEVLYFFNLDENIGFLALIKELKEPKDIFLKYERY